MRSAIVCLVVLAACGGTVRTDVQVDWTFGGQSCGAAGVATMQIAIAGQVLSPDTYSCASAPTGVDLGLFVSGLYDTKVQGFDSAGNLTYAVEVTLDVKGGGAQTFPVDAVAQVGDLNLLWTFAGKTCAQAGLTTVSGTVDGADLVDGSGASDIPCSASGTDGIDLGGLTPGSHHFVFYAQSAAGAAYSGQFDVSITAGQTTSDTVDFVQTQGEAASALVNWTFNSSGTCASAGVDSISIYMDPGADGAGGTKVGEVPCGSGNNVATGLYLYDIADGTHTFAIHGTQGNTLTYYTHAPVSALFSAPNETDLTVDAEPVQ